MGETTTIAEHPAGGVGFRHDPAVVQAVADRIMACETGEQIAKALGISPATVETIVAENEPLRLSRVRVREARADALVDEAQAIIDAPFEDPDTAAAEVSRAKNRADFRKWRAGCYSRDLYGERPPVVAVQVSSTLVLAMADMTPKRVEAEVAGDDSLPHVLPPDGAKGE